MGNGRTVRNMCNATAGVLVGLTMLRLCLIVFAAPIIAFGNNFDFIREESCVGLWQHYADRDKAQAHPQGPVAQLIFDGDRRPDTCVRSIDNLFPYMVTHTHRKHSAIDFRAVGFWKSSVAAALLLLMLVQPIKPALRVGLAAFGFLVIGDINTLSYFNTFYAESSMLLGAYGCLAMAACLLARRSIPHWLDVGAVLAVLALLGLSKQQYGLLAALIGGACAWIILIRWRACAKAALVLAVSLALPLLFNAMNRPADGRASGIDLANRADTVFGAVLPAARNGRTAMYLLGLPASCNAAIGKDWYSAGGSAYALCPQVAEMTRLRLPGLFLIDPGTFLVPMWRAILGSQPGLIDQYGRYERPADAAAPVNRLIRFTSLSFLLAWIPGAAYACLVGGSILLGCALACYGAWRGLAALPGPAVALMAAGGLTSLYATASSVFGDGYYDLPRHAVGIGVGLAAQATGCGLWLANPRCRAIRHVIPTARAIDR
jgi:hypothetical protein